MSNIKNVSEVDFFKIKENLKTFLKSQNEFSDYDFDGAGLNVLLDILSYSTHYNAVQSNLSFNETFLDSAIKRSNVISRARELGYVPFSKHASKAIINVNFSVTANPNEYILPKNTVFNATVDGTTYPFVLTEDVLVENDGSDNYTTNLNIYQGEYSTYTYTVDVTNSLQRFIIPTKNVDTRFLKVSVKDNAQAENFIEWNYFKDLSIENIDSDTQVYFLTESYDGYFEIYFGDDVIGKSIQNGNIIQLSFLVTDDLKANGSNVFTLSSTLNDVNTFTISTIEKSSGGGDRESIDSIKYLAPFYYQSQNRAVTTDDYKVIISNNYADIDDISVWGGEENNPPFYGKVFVAVKPKETITLSDTIKQNIQNDIVSKYSVLSVRPEIIDPEYIDVSVSSVIRYNARLFESVTNTALQESIKTSIENFFNENVNKFARPLYFSKLVNAIDSTSNLIISSSTNLKLSKSLEIFPSISSSYTYDYNNSIYPNSLLSNEFTIGGLNYKIKDVPNGSSPYKTGTLRVFRETDQGAEVILFEDVGSIDYITGEVEINNLSIDSIVNDSIARLLTLTVSQGSISDEETPETVLTDNNIYTNNREQIIRLKDNGISLTMIPDETV